MRRFVVGLALGLAMLAAPSWAMAGDQEIADTLVKELKALKSAGQLKQFGIDLEVDHGVVWLKGHVTSESHRRLVLQTANKIAGVEEVIDDIDVKAAASKTASHRAKKKWLTSLRPTKVLTAPKKLITGITRQDADVKPAIEVESSTVREAHAHEAHTEPAAQQANLVEVAAPAPQQPVAQPIAPAPISDEQIAQVVIERLRQRQHAGELRNFTIDVKVERGSVWIEGQVASRDQQFLVLDTARRVPGVTQVVNAISVPQASVMPISDQRIQPQPARLQPQPVRSPVAFAPATISPGQQPVPMNGASGVARARYDHPTMPAYAWPSYAAYPNYGAVTYPRQYSPAAWPYIGPFYPYPQVPLGWRKVTLEWDDGWWFLDFKSK